MPPPETEDRGGKWERALRWLAPPESFANHDDLRRARVMGSLCLMVGVVGVLRSVGFAAVGDAVLSALYALMAVLLFSLLRRLQATGDLRWPARIFAAVITVIVLTVAWRRGGIGASVLGVLGLLPLAVTYVDGARGGILTAAVAFTSILALSLIEGLGGVVLVDTLATSDHGLDTLTALILPTVGATLGSVYEWSRKRALASAERANAERAQAEAEVAVARADKMATIGMLAAGVGHEVNNPLAYIHSNIDFVLHEMRANSDANSADMIEALVDALDGTERISKIASDLLTYARADGGPHRERVSLTDVAHSALSLSRHELDHRASIEVELNPVPDVVADSKKLVQVALNLFINAAHALDGRDDGRVTIRTDSRGDMAWLEVGDNGPGISAELQSKVFDPFFTTKRAGVGTGLGLSVSKSIVESFEGRLELRSSDGAGATFRIVLPLAEGEGRAATAPETLRGDGRYKILVVDDEVMVGRGLVRLLSAHEVIWCGSGQGAMDLLEGGAAFDLVLCDVMMHPKPGWLVLEYIKRHRPELHSRFAFMTGGTFTEAASMETQAAGVPILTKPVTKDVILQLAESVAEVETSPDWRLA